MQSATCPKIACSCGPNLTNVNCLLHVIMKKLRKCFALYTINMLCGFKSMYKMNNKQQLCVIINGRDKEFISLHSFI